MVLVVFAVFLLCLVIGYLSVKAKETGEEDTLDEIADDVRKRLEIINSQYVLHKITDKERRELIDEVNRNAMRIAEERLTRLEAECSESTNHRALNVKAEEKDVTQNANGTENGKAL